MNAADQTFPAGLVQPAGAFRFSADALYLAFFAVTALSGKPAPRQPLLLDFGTGCGVAALAALRWLDKVHGPVWRAVGVDCQPCLVQAARENAARLGLETRFTALCADVADTAAMDALEPAQMILCNPPWRLEGHGLLPPSAVRRKALFGTPETLPLFARAAARRLAKDGVVCSVIGTERAADQISALRDAGLNPARVAPLRTHPDRPAPFVLIEATLPQEEWTPMLGKR